MTLTELRQAYPTFRYVRCESQLTPAGLELQFEFQTEPELVFQPHLLIPGVSQAMIDRLGAERLQTYVFHLGLVEMLSYWKATCSPQIMIEAGRLTPDQLAWWHQLLIKGMGEYFYVNQIDFTAPAFVTLTAGNVASTEPASNPPTLSPLSVPPTLDSLLLPIGGGKDSSVTIELIKKLSRQPAEANQTTPRLACLLVNPTQAAQDIAQLSGITDVLTVHRQLDPQLLALNQQGFLNGHTPFSALVAFISTFIAELWGLAGIAVSNERSSNEGNVIFHGQEINHQYSKTFEFEQAFQRYTRQWFAPAPHYFSFVRPLFELQIAGLFAQLTNQAPADQLRTVFRSCNRGQKTNSWCGECSKCLFAYTILSPFIDQAELTSMFGKNVLADVTLWPIALELTGRGPNKPLECVGTYEESLIAFYLASQKISQTHEPLPPLLAKIETELLTQETGLAQRATRLLQSWNQAHSLPADWAKWLQTQVSELTV